MPETTDTTILQTPTEAVNARLGRMLRFIMWVFVILAIADMGLWRPMTYYGIDYDKHWQAARALLEGKNNYLGGNLWLGFNYPQMSAFAFVWLGFFTVETGEKVWKLTLLAFLVGCWLLMVRYCRPERPDEAAAITGRPGRAKVYPARLAAWRHWRLLSAFTISAYLPATTGLYLGNIDPLNAIMAVWTISMIVTCAPLLAGVAFALLVLVKMVPVILLLPIVLWRQWRIIKGFLLTMACYFVLLLVTGRLQYEWFFVSEVIPAIPRWWRTISISPYALIMRFGGLSSVFEDPYGFMFTTRIYLAVCGLGYLALIFWIYRRRVAWLRALEVAFVYLPLMSPLLEYHHYVWMLPALILQIRRWIRGELSSRLALVYLAGWGLLYAGFYGGFMMSKFGEWVHFSGVPGYLWLLAVSVADALKAPSVETDHETRELKQEESATLETSAV